MANVPMRAAGGGFSCNDRECVGPDGERFCRHRVDASGTIICDSGKCPPYPPLTATTAPSTTRPSARDTRGMTTTDDVIEAAMLRAIAGQVTAIAAAGTARLAASEAAMLRLRTTGGQTR